MKQRKREALYAGGGGGASAGFHTRPRIPPISPRMKPIMKPPLPKIKFSTENIKTSIEPVLTLPLSPEYIITAPISTIIPKMSPSIPIIIIKPPIHPIPGTMLMNPPKMLTRIAETKPPRIMKMAPTRDKANAAVGFSPKTFHLSIGFQATCILN